MHLRIPLHVPPPPIRHPAIVALCVLLLSGCSIPLSTQPRVPDKTYLLEWSDPSPTPTNPKGPAIRVSQTGAAPGFNGTAMIYVRTPYQLEQYAHHRWVDAPARMFGPLLVRALEGSGLFRAVAGPEESVRADLRLDTELLHLQQVFQGERSTVRLALRVSLVDLARARLLASRVFSSSEPVTGSTPYAGVQTANRATGRVLTALRSWLARQPSVKRSPRPS